MYTTKQLSKVIVPVYTLLESSLIIFLGLPLDNACYISAVCILDLEHWAHFLKVA